METRLSTKKRNLLSELEVGQVGFWMEMLSLSMIMIELLICKAEPWIEGGLKKMVRRQEFTLPIKVPTKNGVLKL